MLQKKICLLGTFAVGKTSLVSRFVHSIFSDRYLTTIGVKIDKKGVDVGGESVQLVLWDLNGEDRFQALSTGYLKGSAGYLLVLDGTRRPSLEVALSLHERAQALLGSVPFVVLVNKADLKDQWELDAEDIQALTAKGWVVLETSAKTGTGVEEAFLRLAQRLVSPS